MPPICPEGMKLVRPDQNKYPGVEPFCMTETEVTQEEDQRFWAEQLKSGYELLVRLASGEQKIRETDLIVTKEKRQPEGNLAGPKKSAIYRNWQDARTYCQSVYPGGDLPDGKQWSIACGEGDFCTASGEESKLNEEADYGRFWNEGPRDVDAFPPNSNGIRGMSGGVWEWTLEDNGEGYKFIRGGSWYDVSWYLRADYRDIYYPPGREVSDVGFRCVAPPQDSKE